MIVQRKVDNKTTRFAPRDRRQIDDYLSAAYGREFKLSDADWRRFNNAADKLNQKGLSLTVKIQAVEAAMDGHGIRDLPPGGGRRLFDIAVGEAKDGVDTDIRQAVLKHNAANKTKIDPDAAVAVFANSHER